MKTTHYPTTIVFIAISFLTLLALTACKNEAPQTMRPRGPVEVEVLTVATIPVELFSEMSGRTSAYRVAEVRPQVNGIIEKRIFAEGAEVLSGELLYQIDPATYQASYDSAKAALTKANAYEYSARLTAERYKTLAKTRAVSEIDQVEKEANWKQALADVEAAKAALNRAAINLDYTKITAPISGIIGKSYITEGALVTAQQSSALAIIQQLDPVYIDVTQSSLEILRLKKKFKAISDEIFDTSEPDVHIILEDGSEYGQIGKLKFSDKTVDQSTGTVTLRAVIANPSQELLPGMFVRAKLSFGTYPGILIPTASIARDQRGTPYVMMINDQSAAEIRTVSTGQDIGKNTLILEGLAAGESIITSGLQNIRPGAPVNAAMKDTPSSQSRKSASATMGE